MTLSTDAIDIKADFDGSSFPARNFSRSQFWTRWGGDPTCPKCGKPTCLTQSSALMTNFVAAQHGQPSTRAGHLILGPQPWCSAIICHCGFIEPMHLSQYSAPDLNGSTLSCWRREAFTEFLP